MDYTIAIKSALEYIENRVAADIRPEQVAQVLGFSLPHSRAVFSRVIGKTISRYIVGRKLSHAAFELMSTGRPVSDIAMDYGFASHDSFTRAFGRAFGEPPSRFRRQRRSVGSTLITQGIYGPAVQLMQEKVILYEHPDTIAVLALGEGKGTPPDKKALLIDTLTYALTIMETPRVHERAAGYAAYDAWAGALLNESEFPAGAPLPLLMERLMCQVDGACMIGDRYQAHRFMQEHAALFPEAKAEMENAAQLFGEEARLALQMGEAIGGMRMGEEQALLLAKRETREELVRLIRQAKELDMQAAAYMKQAVRLLG